MGGSALRADLYSGLATRDSRLVGWNGRVASRESRVTSGEGGSHKLWGGRFAGGPSPLLEAINRSIGTDFRLWPFDVRLSKAWAAALWNAGVLTADESQAIERGLDVVA